MQTVPVPLEIVFDAKEYDLSEAEEQQFRDKLTSLGRQVDQFPTAELRVAIQGTRSTEPVVKLALLLPSRTLASSDRDRNVQFAFDRCLDSLLHELDRYKSQLNRSADAAKLEEKTHHEVLPAVVPDGTLIEQAVRAGDYNAFRRATMVFDDELRMRAGRWVQRYPEVNDLIGESMEIADVVEEVFLMAFEDYDHRPPNVPFGDWLESLIDPALKMLVNHPDEELENIAAVRSLRDAPEGRNPP